MSTTYIILAILSQTPLVEQPLSTRTEVDGGQSVVVPDGGTVGVPELYAGMKEASQLLDLSRKSTEEALVRESQLRAGTLISLGVTGGVAAAGLLPAFSISHLNQNSAEIRTAAPVAIPYVLFVPGYWFLRPAVREYCAAQFNGGDALRSAQAIIEKQADQILDVLDALEPLSANDAAVRNLLKSLLSEISFEDPLTYPQFAAYRKADPAARPALRLKLKRVIVTTLWDPTRPAKWCAATKVGVWIGSPTEVTVGTKVFQAGLDPIQVQSVYRPVAAFGLAIVPNASVSILAGMSYGNVWVGATAEAKGTPLPAWSWILGVGGNLDLVSLLIGVAKQASTPDSTTTLTK